MISPWYLVVRGRQALIFFFVEIGAGAFTLTYRTAAYIFASSFLKLALSVYISH